VLWYADPVGASLALALRWLGPAWSFSGALVLQCAAAAGAAWWLGRRVCGSGSGAFVCACVAGPSAYLVGVLHSGFSEYAGVWVLALFLGVLLDWLDRGERWWAPPLVMGLAALQAVYYGLFCAVVAGCLVVGPGRRWVRIRRVAVVVGFGSLLVLPLLLLVRASVLHPAAIMPLESAPGWVATLPAVDLLGFLAPFDWYSPDTPALGNPGILHVHHLGLVALAFAALGWGHPRAGSVRWGAVVWAVIGLGPALMVGRELVQVAGGPVPLPGRLLFGDGAVLQVIHHPYRLVALTLPLLGLLAALGSERLGRWAPLVGLVVIVEAWALSPAPFPLVGTDPRPPAVYDELPPGAVLDLPPDLRAPNRSYRLWSVSHGRPVPYALSRWLSPSLRQDPEVRELLQDLRLPPRLRNRDIPAREAPWLPTVEHGGLVGLGFGAVVVHEDLLAEQERRRLERRLHERFGPPSRVDGPRVRWDVGAGP